MSGPLFVVELSPGVFITCYCYQKKFPSEIAAQAALNYMRRFEPYPDAKIIRVDDLA